MYPSPITKYMGVYSPEFKALGFLLVERVCVCVNVSGCVRVSVRGLNVQPQ